MPIPTRARTSALGGYVTGHGVAAPLLSQLMHGRETGAGPVEVPSLDTEKELEFDWDRKVWMSERARTALEFMRIAMERYGDAGQPLSMASLSPWPVT